MTTDWSIQTCGKIIKVIDPDRESIIKAVLDEKSSDGVSSVQYTARIGYMGKDYNPEKNRIALNVLREYMERHKALREYMKSLLAKM